MIDFTTALDTENDDLEIVVGKGRSLARLARAGFSVPGGFQVTTAAYRAFVSDNDLGERILELARPEIVERDISFENASAAIRRLFDEHSPADAIIASIRDAHASLEGEPALAVRSSANAEDLPGLSFAGQQETYLNVRGADAVVVQIMVPSEVSGILFTANPATGERSELIVNASFGLGEAVVSGQVTPDTYIVDKASLEAKGTVIGPKPQQIVSDGGQGVVLTDVDEGERGRAALSDAMLRELADTSLAIERLYDGLPQDIEWAFSDGRLYLLQSRPITNLPVQPIEVDWTPPHPAKFMNWRQIVENMPTRSARCSTSSI